MTSLRFTEYWYVLGSDECDNALHCSKLSKKIVRVSLLVYHKYVIVDVESSTPVVLDKKGFNYFQIL